LAFLLGKDKVIEQKAFCIHRIFFDDRLMHKTIAMGHHGDE
jgi:hypothetical protein